MTELIEEGNRLLKKRKFREAVSKYSEALQTVDLSPEQSIRANNNLGIAFQILKEYSKSIEACGEVIKIDEFNEKARLRRSKLFFLQDEYEMVCRELIKIGGHEKIETEKTKIIKNLERKKIFLLDLHELIQDYSIVLNEFVFSKQQLMSIEEGEYHNTWKCQDYFDASTDEKYVPCPKKLFFKKGESDDIPLSENLFYQYVHGSMRSYGMLNIVFCSIVCRLFYKHKKFLHFRRKKICELGIMRGRFVGKSIIFHSVNRNGVIRRDYDDHYWIYMRLEEEKEDIYLDFMSTIFGYYDMYEDCGIPLRIFRESDLKSLRVKERIEDRKKLETFILKDYQEKVIRGYKEGYYNRMMYNFENYLKKKGLLKKDFEFKF